MKNPYKRTDVFACNYQAHAKFNNRVSAYHVMQQKKCYPHGCIMFKWDCVLKNKGKSCVRGFNHVGRLCEGCTYYHDEKIHYQPRVLLSGAEFETFKEQLDEFDEWLQTHQHRDLDIWCEVSSIKPRFRKYFSNGKGQLRLSGYLLVFNYGFIGLTEFDDYFYAHISPHQQDRLRMAAGDQFEARGRMLLDRGRVLFPKLWAIEFTSRSGKPTWNNSKALVAKMSASEFKSQPESCMRCSYGALVDVAYYVDDQKQIKRALYCLHGVQDPALCSHHAFEKIDLCMNDKSE